MARINKWLELHGMHYHWQNLNEKGSYRDEKGRLHTIKGPAWRYGRCWLYFMWDDDRADGSPQLHIEWRFGKGVSMGMLKLDIGGAECEDFTFYFSLPRLVWFSFGLENLIPWKTRQSLKWWPDNWPRETGISLCEDHLSISLWRDDSCSTKGFFYKSWFLKDVVLGRTDYFTETIDEGEIIIQMPEGGYKANYKLFDSTWTRKRWPWPTVLRRVSLKIDKGIPFPGKGENSWDIDDDATYALTCPANSVQEAVEYLVSDILKRRGTEWSVSAKQ